MVAVSWDDNTGFIGSLDNGGAGLDHDGFPVDGDLDLSKTSGTEAQESFRHSQRFGQHGGVLTSSDRCDGGSERKEGCLGLNDGSLYTDRCELLKISLLVSRTLLLNWNIWALIGCLQTVLTTNLGRVVVHFDGLRVFGDFEGTNVDFEGFNSKSDAFAWSTRGIELVVLAVGVDGNGWDLELCAGRLGAKCLFLRYR